MKNLERKQNESGTIVRAEIKNAEITSNSKFNIKFNVPYKDDKNIVVEVNINTDVTSSVLAQEKLQENADKRVKSLIDNLGKAAEMFCQEAPKIQKTMREIEEDWEDNHLPYYWKEKTDKLLALLAKKSDKMMSNKEFLKIVMNNNSEEIGGDFEEVTDKKIHYEYEEELIASWGIAQIERAELGVLNSAEKKSLKSLEII